MENEIKKIMSETFNIEQDTIDNNACNKDIEEWDSLNHINLVLALENHFNIKFNTDDIIEMDSINKIIKYIKKYN